MKKFFTAIALSGAVLLGGCAESNKDENAAANDVIRHIGTYSSYENGIVYRAGDSSMFLDLDTMEKSPLCAVPNCTHTTSSCISKIIGRYVPIFYNEYIYFFTSNGGAVEETPDGYEFYIDSSLKRASLDSSEVETVCEFHDCAPVQGYPEYVLNGSELYFTADDLNPEKGEYGGYNWGTSGGNHFLCSIDLDTGKYTNYGSIYDDDKQYDGAAYSSGANINGIYKDKMYIEYSFIKDNDALQNRENSDELFENINLEFDFETKKWKESELPFTYYMNEDCYIYQDSESNNVKVIYQGKESEFDLGFDSNDFDYRNAENSTAKYFSLQQESGSI